VPKTLSSHQIGIRSMHRGGRAEIIMCETLSDGNECIHALNSINEHKKVNLKGPARGRKVK
jgi:hypothetical protein